MRTGVAICSHSVTLAHAASGGRGGVGPWPWPPYLGRHLCANAVARGRLTVEGVGVGLEVGQGRRVVDDVGEEVGDVALDVGVHEGRHEEEGGEDLVDGRLDGPQEAVGRHLEQHLRGSSAARWHSNAAWARVGGRQAPSGLTLTA